MSLPKLEVPTYTCELPTGKTVKYRPFFVKEHKQLLIMQNGDADAIQKVIGDLLTACTFNEVDGHKLPSVDAEYLFLQVRARSISEVFDFIVNCDGKIGDVACGNKIDTQTNIDDLKVVKPEKHTKMIQLSDNILLEMRYPLLEETIKVYESEGQEEVFAMILNSIKAIHTRSPEKTIEIDSDNKEELKTFVDDMTKEQFDKVEEFFATMPYVVQHVSTQCNKCGKINNINIRGLENFFI